MTPDDVTPIPELTPEQKAKVYAHFDRQFTPERLIEYIDNQDPGRPADEVLAEADEWLRRYEAPPAEAA